MQSAEIKPLMHALASKKIIGAHAEDSSYEVSVQEISWEQPGEIHVLSGSSCLIELAEMPAQGRATYSVQVPGGDEQRFGRLNFMPPNSERIVRWTTGRRQAVVCVMDPRRLGVLGAADWRWNDSDQARTLDVQNPKLQTGMQWLADEVAAPSFASELQISCILTMLAIELYRFCDQGKAKNAVPSGLLSNQQLSLLKELIECSVTDSNFSLETLAAACQMPARELSLMFKRTMGQTIRSYVAATHIRRAKLLLDDANLLVKQVAYRSGFRSAAAFGEAFRKATGQTPQQYRQGQGNKFVDMTARPH